MRWCTAFPGTGNQPRGSPASGGRVQQPPCASEEFLLIRKKGCAQEREARVQELEGRLALMSAQHAAADEAAVSREAQAK